MTGSPVVLSRSTFSRSRSTVSAPERAPRLGWRERWRLVRELLGGALLLVVWLALWTVTWAAVAGPLSPADGAPARPPAVGAGS